MLESVTYPRYFGTGNTLSPTQEDGSRSFAKAVYEWENVKFRNTVYGGFTSDVWGNQLGFYQVNTQSPSYIAGLAKATHEFSQYGIIGTDWVSYLQKQSPELQKFVYVGAGYDPSQSGAYGRENNVLETFKSRPGIDPFVLAFTKRYGLEGANENAFYHDFMTGAFWKPRSTGGSASIWDRVFSTPFISTFVENPISAITKLEKVFSNSPSDNIQALNKSAVGDVPKVNFARLGFESGINTLSNVGFAFGVEGATQGISSASAASRALPVGTAGPVSPGFWSSVGTGNFGAAFQIAKNTFAVSTGGATTFVSRQGSSVFAQQAVSTFVKFTGDVGKGFLQLFSADFVGALQSFGLTPGPATQPNPFGFGSGGSGGGSGGGFLPSQKTGQVGMNVLPFLMIGGAIMVIWLLFRKVKS